MGNTGSVENRIRMRFRSERERHKWSQKEMALQLERRGISGIHVSTVSKIESGNRAMTLDELVAFSDIFGITIDELMGKSSARNDLLLSVSRLTSMAQKSSAEISVLYHRFNDELQDLERYSITDQNAVPELRQHSSWALELLQQTHDAMKAIADSFPLMKRSEEITSGTIHRRISALRGPARTHLCVECGNPADDWSYDHRDLGERQGQYGPYSLNLNHYQARCTHCHLKLDMRMKSKGRSTQNSTPPPGVMETGPNTC